MQHVSIFRFLFKKKMVDDKGILISLLVLLKNWFLKKSTLLITKEFSYKLGDNLYRETHTKNTGY